MKAVLVWAVDDTLASVCTASETIAPLPWLVLTTTLQGTLIEVEPCAQ